MRETEDRTFYDMDAASIEPYLKGLFTPIEIWKSADTHSTVAPSPDRSWLHFNARHILFLIERSCNSILRLKCCFNNCNFLNDDVWFFVFLKITKGYVYVYF